MAREGNMMAGTRVVLEELVCNFYFFINYRLDHSVKFVVT